MADSVSSLIAELTRAAKETEKLTKPERARLLQSAAATLRDYRYQVNFSKAPANDVGPIDVAHDWSVMARLIELFSAEEVSKALPMPWPASRPRECWLRSSGRSIRGDSDGFVLASNGQV